MLLVTAWGAASAATMAPNPTGGAWAQALAQRDAGQLSLAVQTLQALRAQSLDDLARARIDGEIALAHAQAGRHEAAQDGLAAAAQAAPAGPERARWQLLLGRTLWALGEQGVAVQTWQSAALTPGLTPALALALRLQLAQAQTGASRTAALQSLAQSLLDDAATPWALRLQMAHQLLDEARPDAARVGALLAPSQGVPVQAVDALMQAEGLHAQARLAEALQQWPLAQQHAERAIALLSQGPGASAGDLPLVLQAQLMRIFRAQGQTQRALLAAERAIEQIEALRQDLPISDEQGRSLFSQLLEPIYLGFIDLLLPGKGPVAGPHEMARALQAIEGLRQAEMQDFLGDRCNVDSQTPASRVPMAAGTAMLYTLALSDRLVLLLRTEQGLEVKSLPVSRATLREGVVAVTERLRDGLPGHQRFSRVLHDWLILPLADTLAQRRIEHLVLVPDGSLRLLPFAALHDGQRYLIERMAVSTLTGASMTNLSPSQAARAPMLMAGVSMPGAVLQHLPPDLLDPVAPSAGTTAAQRRWQAPSGTPDPARLRALQQELALPGVRAELQRLQGIAGGQALLDEAFSLARWSELAGSGQYRVLHIASHGVFGGSAERSFLMAHDDVLRTDRIEALLQTPALRLHPIELLTLSACQTAEGNERAPLGIAGVAMRARAKSVMGTLWPVADQAATQLMGDFYQGLRQQGLNKAQALRQAQRALLQQPGMDHPLFWSPFVLIGNWQ